MLNTNGKFYLGRIFDPAAGETTAAPLLYDPADLTTHAVVVGMTGSGKTGLCIGLLEEAALNNIPALMIDPKGDITNALLHFPDLLPGDFAPWVNADAARREGKSVAQAAEETAALWRKGLAQWDITPERIRALKNGPQFAIYTPGSDAGLPVSILASLKAPEIAWETDREMLREKIASTATALLGLIGFRDVDPVRSREHILLANIFEHAWSQGRDLDLGELIMQVQTPPFEKLGFFDVNTFFPERDRFELAMLLNNILAAPAFQSWIEGEPLDVGRMLYTPDGRPRHTIFYIAHLSDAERMFFVTLLYSAVESWMRALRGVTSLRALVYFDEIFGYLPPVGNPPSKTPILRLLKQARAFGVGLLLATQNPVDIDYKALSNAGTWFIGRLGTEQDKQRLLDGLSSALGGGLDRREYDNLISALGKRVFLMRNVHDKHPTPFQTRWVMNYLAGPVTRMQIPALNALAAAAPARGAQPTAPHAEPAATLPGSETRPAVPSGVMEYFLPNNLTLAEAARRDGRSLPGAARSRGLLYRPVLLAQASVRYLRASYKLDHELRHTALVSEPDRRGLVYWEKHLVDSINPRELDRHPAPEARFAPLEPPLTDSRMLRSLGSDFKEWIFRNGTLQVKANTTLKLYAGPDVDDAAFHKQCLSAAENAQAAEVDKLQAQYNRKLDALRTRKEREKRKLSTDEAELARRRQDEIATHAETLFSLFSRRRRSVSTSMSKRRMTERAKANVEKSATEIETFKREIEALEREAERALDDIADKWEAVAADVTQIPVAPYKKDIAEELFGVAWWPYNLVQIGDDLELLPGFALDARRA
jgi:hypothetical protein